MKYSKEQFIKVCNDYLKFRQYTRPVKAFSIIAQDVEDANPEVEPYDVVKMITAFGIVYGAHRHMDASNIQKVIDKYNVMRNVNA